MMINLNIMSANKVVPLFLEVVVLISLVVTTSVSVKPSNRAKCLNTIKEVNRKGPYIGLITVFPPEKREFFATQAFKHHPTHPFVDLAGRRFRVGKKNGKNVIYFFSESGTPNIAQPLLWAEVRMALEQCVNSSLCLTEKPKRVVGLGGSTANIFVDNAAYRDFLFQTFQVSLVDMESSAVVMTSLSNGLPVIVIRGLSDIA
ncbi:hypothetical protein QYF36_017189 [Acer negundo]|nr:hypothetical protein QYF36_017189 [Acer negundo]